MSKYTIFYEDGIVGNVDVAAANTIEEAKDWIALQNEEYVYGVPEEGKAVAHYEVFDLDAWNDFVERFGRENLCPMDFIVYTSPNFYVTL